MSGSARPTLASVIARSQSQAAAQVRGAEPGVVVSYDRATQTATVQPLQATRYQDGATGQVAAQAQPAVANVPILFPCGGGFSLTWEVMPGDSVLLIPADRSLDEWKAGGGATQQHTPNDTRRFSPTDFLALPQGRPPSAALSADQYKEDATVIYGETILLGDSTADAPVAKATVTDSNFDLIRVALAGLGIVLVLPSTAATTTFVK